MEAPHGLETFAALQREFPQATIVTLSLSELLAAVQESADHPKQSL